ncbi:hypothetical protein [Texcoconibacillus texcoconensis]|uniref:Uncharacterized protein n=1 Tax=Texcoconibacillus texcoconensis TaxID=1095777 RepID=A0A840QRD3_9BACI|nr:hypothetical protein [Texcoconibacillus texcoconensis]MBB5173847.1 hypothetical protein [Texcoconibacillus texcoconensis]
MAIKESEFFHGTVLSRILRKKEPTSLEKIESELGDKWSSYIINDRTIIHISHRKSTRTGLSKYWYFSFTPDQLKELKHSFPYKHTVALVCLDANSHLDQAEICFLNKKQTNQLIDPKSKADQHIRITLENKQHFKVYGSLRDWHHALTIDRNQIDQVDM